MEVSKLNHILQSREISPKEKLKALQQSLAEKQYEQEASKANCSFGQALVNMQNPTDDNSKLDDISQFLNSITQYDNCTVYRINYDKSLRNNDKDTIIIRAKAGTPIPNWKNLYNEDLAITCYCDKNKNIKKVYIQNNKTKEIEIYNSNKVLEKTYSASEMAALKEYKYSPEKFHDYLRYNKPSRFKSEEELWGIINKIDDCFSESKAEKTDKPTIVYRALQSNLSENDKAILSTTGAIYKDNSFVSTSTELETAQRFNTKGNPILEITLPENTKYIDLDKLFNVDYEHWREQEYLLKRGSEFLITGYDPEKNIIKASYLNR